MEDQGRRLLLAVTLAFGIVVVWGYLFPTEPPQEPPGSEDTGSHKTKDDQDTSVGTAPSITTDGKEPSLAPVAEVVDTDGLRKVEDFASFAFDFPAFRAEFTSYGGTLKSWRLKGEKYQEQQGGKTVQKELVATSNEDLFLFDMRFKDLKWPKQTDWQGERVNDTEIEFTWSYKVRDAGGGQQTAFVLTKHYRLFPDDYLVELTIEAKNIASSDEKQVIVVSTYGYQDPKADTGKGWTRVDSAWKGACYVDEELTLAPLKELESGPMRNSGSVSWGGFDHPYFLIAAAPRVDSGSYLGCNTYRLDDIRNGTMRTDIEFPEVKLDRGGSVSYQVHAYLGPKYLDKLESIPRVVGYDTGFSHAIDIGWFSFLARPMLWLLQWFHSFLGSWGLAIIALTFLVKLATLYWTNKSMRSMKAMSKLKPKIEALQKKYKDDKQRQQVEMMNLYKAHNVNPLAGCLPMLLQMPIWIALYRMLMAAAELYHVPFLWISNLTGTDYVLPGILMITMFVQARISPSVADSAQQKVMMYGMPLMFGVFAFFFPAGLALYMLTNTLLTLVHHVWMNRTEASAVVVDVAKENGDGDKSGSIGDPGADALDSTALAGTDQGDNSATNKQRSQQRKRGGKRKRGK